MSGAKNPFRNVPPPNGTKAPNAYTRFIPREELGEVASWRPGSFGGAAGAEAAESRAAAAPPPEPTAAEWQVRATAARQAGYQDGYRDGLAALENFKQQFAAQATAQVGSLLDAFERQYAAMDERLAETLARAAVLLAREVVRNELVTAPALVARVASEALGAVMLSAKHITVLAHPLDLPLIAEGAEETLAARGARLVADTGVERGGVRIESDVGRVDAGIARRWQQASEVMAPGVNWVPPDAPGTPTAPVASALPAAAEGDR